DRRAQLYPPPRSPTKDRRTRASRRNASRSSDNRAAGASHQLWQRLGCLSIPPAGGACYRPATARSTVTGKGVRQLSAWPAIRRYRLASGNPIVLGLCPTAVRSSTYRSLASRDARVRVGG